MISLRLAPLLLVGVAVAVATTSGTLRVRPSALVLVAGAAALAAALVLGRRRPWVALGGALVAGAVAGHVLLSPGVPRVHDLMHFWGIWAYGRCVGEGVLFPQWIPYIGLGIPLLQFYGALNFLLALPGVLLGLSPVGAWKLEMFSGHLLAPVATLAAARMLGAGWRGGLVAACAVALAPWRLAVFDYRGALGEANAFLFMPLVVAGALRLARRPALGTAAVLVAGLAGLLLTHAVSLLTTLIVLLPCLLVQELAQPTPARLRRAAWIGVTSLAAAGLTALFWLPVLAEQRHTSVTLSTADNLSYRYEEQGLSVTDPFERRRWDRMRVALPRTVRERGELEGEQMPFYSGAVLIVAALGAPFWSRRRATWAPAVGVLLALALSTSAMTWLDAVVPGLSQVRFPWRFLSPCAVLAALAVGSAIAPRESGARRWANWAPLVVLVGLLVWDGAPYTGAADRIPPYRGVVHWYTDDPHWVHWDESLRQVPVELGDEGVVNRVRNLELPPERYSTAVDWFYPAYYEWLTPTVYKAYWRPKNPARMIEAGVSYGFTKRRAEPVRWPARGYASLETRLGSSDLPADAVRREPGGITIGASVPEGGATLVVREQAFPGWRVRIDGGAWTEPRAVRGFLATDLEGGERRVELDYGMHTPARQAGLITTLIFGLAIAVGLCTYGLRKT